MNHNLEDRESKSNDKQSRPMRLVNIPAFETPILTNDSNIQSTISRFNPPTTHHHDVEPQEEDKASYPEGGLRAWLVVLGSFMGTIVSLGTVSTVGIFHSYLSEHQLKGYTESAIATIGIYFMEWALFVPITYLSTFSTSTGTLSPAFSYELIAIMNAGSCIGRWASGYVADKLGRFNSMIAALALCAATTVTLWLPIAILDPTAADATVIEALIIIYAVIFGFASGSNISLTPVCVGQLCHTNSYGRYYATCYTIVSFGTLTGIPIAGALVQAAGGHYWGVVAWTFLCYIVSLGCFIWSRACQVGWKLGMKI